jgi:O-antigen/teichoic acid export membrane protein
MANELILGAPTGTVMPATDAPVAQQVGFDGDQRIRLMRDGIINFSGVAFPGLIGLLLVPIMLRALGAETYGVWIAALSLIGILEVLGLGLDWSITREVAAAAGAGDRTQLAPFVTTVAILYAAAGVIGGLIVATVGIPLSHALGMGRATHQVALTVFFIQGFTCVGNHFTKFTTAVLEGMRRFSVCNALSIAASVLRAAGIIVLLLLGGRLVSIAVWWAFVALLMAVVGLFVILRLEPQLRSRRFLAWKDIRGHLQFGLVSQVNTGFVKMAWESAPVVAGMMMGSAAIVPLYVGQRFPFALSLVHDRAAGVLYPAASEVAQSQPSRSRELLEAGLRYVLLVALPCSLVLWLIAPNFLHAWLGTVPPGSVAIMRITTAAVLVDGLGLASIQILWARGLIYRLSAIFALMAFVSIGFTVALLNRIGIVGAAWAFLLAAMLGAGFALRGSLPGSGRDILRVISRAMHGLFWPAAAAALAAGAVLHVWTAGRLAVVAAGIAAVVVYGAGLAFYGARDEERRLARQFVTFPLEALSPSVKHLREALKRLPGLRSARHFAKACSEALRDPWASAHRLGRGFVAHPGRGEFGSPREQQRLAHALELLDKADERFSNALEIGCTEGVFTEMLLARCDSLLVVDPSRVALERAQRRCHQNEAISFRQWDLRSDEVPAGLELIVAMCVLKYLRRPSDLRLASEKMVLGLRPGGYLLVSHARQSVLRETSRWKKWLLRDGIWINSFLAQHPALEVVTLETGESYVNCLFRKRAAM